MTHIQNGMLMFVFGYCIGDLIVKIVETIKTRKRIKELKRELENEIFNDNRRQDRRNTMF